jgi:hypothetical protein
MDKISIFGVVTSGGDWPSRNDGEGCEAERLEAAHVCGCHLLAVGNVDRHWFSDMLVCYHEFGFIVLILISPLLALPLLSDTVPSRAGLDKVVIGSTLSPPDT